jgi:hypothetical protein
MTVSLTGGSGSATLSLAQTNTAQIQTITKSVQNLSKSFGNAPINTFTPGSLGGTGTQSRSAIRGDVNIAEGHAAPGATVNLQDHPLWQGVILTGDSAARIVGHAGQELLVGNNAIGDTINGGGGTGTIVSGSGTTLIKAMTGDFTVDSGGVDTIFAGSGVVNVVGRDSATVHGGAGFTIFTDQGTSASAFKVKAGSGFTDATSGKGSDTFVGGSGTSIFKDGGGTAGGAVDFKFNEGVGGTNIIEGFSARDMVTLNGFNTISQANVTVIGGNSFLDIQGTKLEFVGVSITVSSGGTIGV